MPTTVESMVLDQGMIDGCFRSAHLVIVIYKNFIQFKYTKKILGCTYGCSIVKYNKNLINSLKRIEVNDGKYMVTLVSKTYHSINQRVIYGMERVFVNNHDSLLMIQWFENDPQSTDS